MNISKELHDVWLAMGQPDILSGIFLPIAAVYLKHKVASIIKHNNEYNDYIKSLMKKNLATMDELKDTQKLLEAKIHGLEKRIDDLNLRG